MSHLAISPSKNIICITDIMKTFLAHFLQCSLTNVERLVLEKKPHFSFDKDSYLVPMELNYKLHIFRSPSSCLPNGQISMYVRGTDPTCSKPCPVFLFLQQIFLRGIYSNHAGTQRLIISLTKQAWCSSEFHGA